MQYLLVPGTVIEATPYNYILDNFSFLETMKNLLPDVGISYHPLFRDPPADFTLII